MIRAIIPDSHGSAIDLDASAAFIRDLKHLDPREIVMLGDHVDVSGIFSVHQPSFADELDYSYEDDCAAASRFLDSIQKTAPRATIHYIAGNHEGHMERWVARTFANKRDAKGALVAYAPEVKLELKRRGIRYYRSDTRYNGLSVPGTIRLGRCCFCHGARAGKYATAAILEDYGTSVVHGHTHRAQSHIRRNLSAGTIGAWCPGTLAELQPLYLHTGVSAWSHGYAIQMVERDGRFLHVNVPITAGQSLLKPLLDQLRPSRLFGGKR